MAGHRELEGLEKLLDYSFVRIELLERALTHRSFANESSGAVADNERLEFLGDAVLDLVVGHHLMDAYPDLREGELSVTRAQVVSEIGLSGVAAELGLGQFLRLGVGEERTGGRDKPSLLANAFEAIVAAVYLDGGFEAARALALRLLAGRMNRIDATGFHDFKTRLQESAQAKLKATPEYRVISETGPDHAKTFEVAVFIKDREWARAAGTSKKAAEQRAAAMAAFLLDGADLESD